jgi:hypothetical protein
MFCIETSWMRHLLNSIDRIHNIYRWSLSSWNAFCLAFFSESISISWYDSDAFFESIGKLCFQSIINAYNSSSSALHDLHVENVRLHSPMITSVRGRKNFLFNKCWCAL